MRICPSCHRTYADDAQKFCLQDGTPLVDPVPSSPEQNVNAFGAQQPAGAPASQPMHGGGAQPNFNAPPAAAAPLPSWQAAPPPPPPAAAPRKRKVWPWVLGIVGVLVIGFVALLGVGGYLVYKYGTPEGGGTINARDARTFTNTRDGLSGKLAEHYADFTFSYPKSWEINPEDRNEGSNFVKVERKSGDMTLENFAVGWYTSTGSMSGDRALFPQLAGQLSSQFAKGFPEYQKVSEGETKVGSYSGYEFRFKSSLKDSPRGAVNIFGRVVLIPSGSAAQRNGVALVMLATSAAPEIKGAQDVGTKGQLPFILNSFRLAASGGTSTSDASKSDQRTLAASAPSDDAASAPTGEGEVLEDLKTIEEEWAQANIEGDKEAIENILADEYVGVAGDGSPNKKADYLRTLKPDASIKSQTFDDLDLSLKGNTAVLTGLTNVKFANGTNEKFRFTDTFTWREGRWQAVSSHASRIQ